MMPSYSLSVFIVSDSEEIEEEDSDEEIENRHLLTNINIPESPLPRIRVTNSSPGSCFTPSKAYTCTLYAYMYIWICVPQIIYIHAPHITMYTYIFLTAWFSYVIFTLK